MPGTASYGLPLCAVRFRDGIRARGWHSMPCAWRQMQAAAPRTAPPRAASELDADADGQAIFMRPRITREMLEVHVTGTSLRQHRVQADADVEIVRVRRV